MMKRKPFLFSIISAVFIAIFLFVVNRLTSWGLPWFIYPTLALLWWPLSVYVAQHKAKKLMAIVGSLLVAITAVVINWVTSPGFPWAVFPVFAVLWWPLAVLLQGKPKAFAIAGGIYAALFFLLVNIVTGFSHPWFIYPCFAVLWWPLAVLLWGKPKAFSIIGALYIIAFFALLNFLVSPGTLWFFYVAYAVLWWPLSVFFAKRSTIKLYSVIMSVLTVALLALVNMLYSPAVLWWPWAAFYFIWWPVVMLLGKRAGTLWFAVISALVIMAYYVAAYFVITPGAHPWYLYTLLPVLWWPVTIALKRHANSFAFLVGSAVIFILYYGALNLMYSPHHFWSIYLIYPFAWAVIGRYFGTRSKFFALAIWGTLISIAFFFIVNLITSPAHLWAVYPSVALLFWPLSYYFFKHKKA